MLLLRAKDFITFLYIGAAAVLYIYLIFWSHTQCNNLSTKILHRKMYKFKQSQRKVEKAEYPYWLKFNWKDMLAIPLYIITTGPVITLILISIGAAIYWLFTVLIGD